MKSKTKIFKDHLTEIVQFACRRYCEVWSNEYPYGWMINEKQIDYQELRNFIKKGSEICLYIHFPFCKSKCDYCAYYTSNNIKKFGSRKYIDCLKKEIDLILGRKENKVTSIYLGGGTPTLISPKHLNELFVYLKQKLKITDETSITIEATPNSISQAMANMIKKTGINKVSIGVQTFDENTLTLVNRKQKNREVHKAINILRKFGNNNINLDLIFGLNKNENAEQFLKINLPHLKKIKPELISLHHLQHYDKYPDTVFKFNTLETKKIKKEIKRCTNYYTKVVNCIEQVYLKDVSKDILPNEKTHIDIYTLNRRKHLINTIGIGLGASTNLWNKNKYRRVIHGLNTCPTNRLEKYNRALDTKKIKYKTYELSVNESIRKYVINRLLKGLNMKIVRKLFKANEKEMLDILKPLRPMLKSNKQQVLFLKEDYARNLPFHTGNNVVNYFIFSFFNLYSEKMQNKILDKFKKFKLIDKTKPM